MREIDISKLCDLDDQITEDNLQAIAIYYGKLS